MQIKTTRFGALVVDDSSVITFPEGLPGFEGCRHFAFVPHRLPSGDKAGPFEWLQSMDDGDLAFLAIDPRRIFPHYRPAIPRTELTALALDRDRGPEPRIYSLLTVPKADPCGITANLMAPVVVNPTARVAKQIVLEGDEYGLRHRLLPEPAAVC